MNNPNMAPTIKHAILTHILHLPPMEMHASFMPIWKDIPDQSFPSPVDKLAKEE
jgi:hypothetical protein